MRQVLHEPGDRIDYVYFPLDGMCCLLTVLNDGSAIEVATVGKEGMLGVGAFLHFDSYLWRGICQVPGRVLRLRVPDFKKELDRAGNLSRSLRGYVHALLMKISQAAVCNRLHPTEQRLAKWLLLTHDRVGSDEFPLTHQFLSQMLGVRRASVSEVAAKLQQDGLIRYRRGVVTVLDRSRLEAISCECYSAIRAAFDRINL